MTEFFNDPKFKPLYQKIMDLNELVWENKLDGIIIEQWLDNFNSKKEKLIMLDLLSKFTFYNEKEIMTLLRYAYGLLKNYFHLTAIKDRKDLGDLDSFIQNNCYFVGTWENPSKSGNHLLYNFRILNNLSQDIFCSTVKDVSSDAKFVVFLDDIAGSGRQASSFWKTRVTLERQHLTNTQFLYLILVGDTKGIAYIEKQTGNKVLTVVELDERYNVFSNNSIYYNNINEKNEAKQICETYGKKLLPNHPLGYDDSQLLIGFHHNVPDNTLPVIWSNQCGWNPIFPRNVGA